uniref:Protein kinase domain-containing protein n=1 Tax=Helicotheca tamesis TaxID=374047 RepID=A0A7S2MIH6_9STRA|mmetsp:Transcript_1669/g.2411  ORF Transcript_1669/g.2411 Transcript_1669/m.2411 type:complete len:435 (+) Transcript_1669:40-1344(+)
MSAPSAPPSAPIPFPTLALLPARRLNAYVDVPHVEGDDISMATLRRRDSVSGNVVVRVNADGSFSSKAYWVQRKVSKVTCGSVRAGYVLRPMASSNEDAYSATRPWEVIPTSSSTANAAAMDDGSRNYEMVTIKMFDRAKLSALGNKTVDGPLTELSVLQMIADMHPEAHHVLGGVELLSDDRYIYCIMPYTGDGNVLEYIGNCGRLTEGAARYFFRQILEGLSFIESAGICDRGLSLARVLLNGNNSFISVSSMCLRVPYTSSGGENSVTDISNGITRRLITPQGQCGNQNYIPPEILSNEGSFDGYAVHTWAAGVMLFVMLFGKEPFIWATTDDSRYRTIAVDGKLSERVDIWLEEEEKTELGAERCSSHPPHLAFSEKAIDLLQKMLRADAKERLSLSEIMEHEWVVDGEVEMPPSLAPTPRDMVTGEVQS